MSAGVYNLAVNQGTTFTRVFLWTQSPCSGQGTAGAQPMPVNLTGFTAAMQIRAFPLATSILYDASMDLVLGGTSGTITLTIDANDTENFTWWTGVYDLLLTSPTGYVTRLLMGSVTVSPAVTMLGELVPLLADDGTPLLSDSGNPLYNSQRS